MTRDEILNILKESEIDALIAQKVMGLPVVELENAPCPYCGDEMRFCGTRSWCSTCHEWRYSPYKNYTDEIEPAWGVVEKLCNETGCDIAKVCKRDPELLRGEWSCNFGRGFEAFGDTAPLAICRAALLAVMDKDART